MKREIDLKEISDGRLYTANDMVKIGCSDCRGCSECCRIVGDTILLDPYDIYQLEGILGVGFQELLGNKLELGVVDGLICPHLKMKPEGAGCVFLSGEGRCTIHTARPGFCRMFPMGRVYQEDGFKYFLQIYECAYPNKTKVKLRKWLGIPSLERYEEYVKDWHKLTLQAAHIVEGAGSQEIVRKLNLYLLNEFYVNQYEMKEDFYGQFYQRLEAAAQVVSAYA